MMEPEVQSHSTLSSSVRLKCSQHLLSAQWHHLCLVMAKGIKKSCLVTVYINGAAVGTAKVGSNSLKEITILSAFIHLHVFPNSHRSYEKTNTISCVCPFKLS